MPPSLPNWTLNQTCAISALNNWAEQGGLRDYTIEKNHTSGTYDIYMHEARSLENQVARKAERHVVISQPEEEKYGVSWLLLNDVLNMIHMWNKDAYASPVHRSEEKNISNAKTEDSEDTEGSKDTEDV